MLFRSGCGAWARVRRMGEGATHGRGCGAWARVRRMGEGAAHGRGCGAWARVRVSSVRRSGSVPKPKVSQRVAGGRAQRHHREPIPMTPRTPEGCQPTCASTSAIPAGMRDFIATFVYGGVVAAPPDHRIHRRDAPSFNTDATVRPWTIDPASHGLRERIRRPEAGSDWPVSRPPQTPASARSGPPFARTPSTVPA